MLFIIPDLHDLTWKPQLPTEPHLHQTVLLYCASFHMYHQSHHGEFQPQLFQQPAANFKLVKKLAQFN